MTQQKVRKRGKKERNPSTHRRAIATHVRRGVLRLKLSMKYNIWHADPWLAISMQAKCCVYVNHLMAFCIGEILKCFVNCSASITAYPIDRPIKPCSRSTTYTTFLQRATFGKWFSLWALQPAGRSRGTRCVRRNAPRARSSGGERTRAGTRDCPMIDREIKCKTRRCSRNPISHATFGLCRSTVNDWAMNFPRLLCNRYDRSEVMQLDGVRIVRDCSENIYGSFYDHLERFN